MRASNRLAGLTKWLPDALDALPIGLFGDFPPLGDVRMQLPRQR
jgi:hypothetical protein